MKAKKIETCRDKYYSYVVYEYRGKRYEVEYSNSWNCLASPAWYQHKVAQEKIDDELDHPKQAQISGETVQESLNRFFDYLDGNENAFD